MKGKPIAMKCTKEQFESISQNLKKEGLKFNTVFIEFSEEYPYLTNFYSNKINSLGWRANFLFTAEEIHETWNERIFLEACGVEVEETYKITREQILKLERICISGRNYSGSYELKELFPSVFKEDEKELVVCEYWFHSTGDLCLVFEVNKETVKCKHINNSEHFAYHGVCCMDRKATSQEIQQALEKEARKRYKKGDFTDCLECGKSSLNCELILDDFDFYFSENELWVNFINRDSNNPVMCCVFKKGVWAEIIPTITIKEAEEKLKCKII